MPTITDRSESLPGLFVVGTDTDVGKTYLTARIARQLLEAGVSVGAYKPVCSGCEVGEDGSPRWADVEVLAEALGHTFPRERICPQTFRAALAPPVAARLEGRRVDQELAIEGVNWWRDHVDCLLIEGVGGLLCPLTESWTVCNLAERWGFPLLIVARLGLGTINHTLLTVEVAKRRGLEIAGIVLNESRPGCGGEAGETNAREIEARCDLPILAVIPYRNSNTLRLLPETSTINWRRFFGPGGVTTE